MPCPRSSSSSDSSCAHESRPCPWPRGRHSAPSTNWEASSAACRLPDTLRIGAAPWKLLLVDPDRGMNLRNNICHGLIDTPPKHRVALILQAAVFLLSHAHGHRTLAPLAQPAP
ncbi:DUF4209 domain-containing protein [Streptomyces sp. NPDC004561]